MDKRSESFGRLLRAGMAGAAAIESKTQQAIEAELGALIGVAGATMQRYKAGHIPPDQSSIELLAEAGVQRGLLGQLWVERFLEAARYPAFDARALAARLFPAAPAAQSRAIRPNLPAPTYTRFIMRSVAYEALLVGLCSDLPATLLVSIGGMGKTSLARVAAGDCLEGRAPGARFDCVVWVSDKDHPGTTNLSTTLDEIARVLDYPGLMALPFAERRREAEELLRRQPVLLVVDNAETISDAALLDWLVRLPGPSKALVTSRFALAALADAYLVELGPMSDAEVRALIAEWLPRSRLRGLAGAVDQLTPVATAVGGNPKAAEVALGLLQHRALHEVIADLAGARAQLFDELFARAWDLLDGAARRVLLALPLFPSSAAAEALAYCADLSTAAFQRSVDRLAGLSLLDVERADLLNPPRYNAHALVRAYALARLSEIPGPEQTRLRERWLGWHAELAASIGFCWDDLSRLDALDSEYVTIQAAIAWAVEHGRDEMVMMLVEGIRYYYNVRGLWGEDELRNLELRVVASRRMGDHDNELLSLAHRVEILSKQGRIVEAEALMEHLGALGESTYRARLLTISAEEAATHSLRDDAAFEYGHALALYALARGDVTAAEAHWRQLIVLSQALGGQKYVVNRRWLATALLQQGRVAEARAHYVDSLDDARRIGDVRSVAGNTLKLAMIDLRSGDLESAAAALADCEAVARRHRDRRRLAECHALMAQLLDRRGDAAGALGALEAALDLFERLGMRREVVETRAAIDKQARPVLPYIAH
jgi:tetratricopeptide (TPR) repeat protein